MVRIFHRIIHQPSNFYRLSHTHTHIQRYRHATNHIYIAVINIQCAKEHSTFKLNLYLSVHVFRYYILMLIKGVVTSQVHTYIFRLDFIFQRR